MPRKPRRSRRGGKNERRKIKVIVGFRDRLSSDSSSSPTPCQHTTSVPLSSPPSDRDDLSASSHSAPLRPPQGVDERMINVHYYYYYLSVCLSVCLSVSLTHTHTRTHKRTHTQTHSHIYTHTHTHTKKKKKKSQVTPSGRQMLS